MMPESPLLALSPREALFRYQRAISEKDTDNLADLYAEDAVHEYPFPLPGGPQRLVGREAIRTSHRELWASLTDYLVAIQEVAIHETEDPQVLIAEQVVMVARRSAEGEPLAIPGLMVIRVQDGEIVHVRDYLDTATLARACA